MPLIFWTHYCALMLGKCEFVLLKPQRKPQSTHFMFNHSNAQWIHFTVLQFCPRGSFLVQWSKMLSNTQQSLCFKTRLTIFKHSVRNACLMCLLEISTWFQTFQRNLLNNILFLVCLLILIMLPVLLFWSLVDKANSLSFSFSVLCIWRLVHLGRGIKGAI